VGAPTLRAVMRSGELEGGYVGAPTTSIPSQNYMKLHCDPSKVLIVEALKIVLG